MFCPECGKEISDESVFCGYCGSSICDDENTISHMKIKSSTKSFNKKSIIIISVLSIVIITTLLLAIFSGQMNQSVKKQEQASKVIDSEKNKEKESNHIDIDTDTITINNNPEIEKDVLDETIQLSDNEMTELNKFLSNFSETWFVEYDSDTMQYSDYDLINMLKFAFLHNRINSPQNIIYTGETEAISAETVNKTLERFFGKTIPLKAPEYQGGHGPYIVWDFNDGNFITDSVYTDTYQYFSIVKNIAKNNDKYDVEFDVFFAGNSPGIKMSDWYTYTIDTANKDFEFCYSGYATVKPKKYNEKNTYELVRCSIAE